MPTTNLYERYKQSTPEELLSIIQHPQDYEPEALEAAKKELESRNLPEDELERAHWNLRAKEHRQEQQWQQQRDRVERIFAPPLRWLQVLNPLQQGVEPTGKYLNLLGIFLCWLCCSYIYRQWNLLSIITSDGMGGIGKLDLSILYFFYPILVFPVAAILLWKRKKLGWILTTVWCTFSICSALLAIVSLLFYNREENAILPLSTGSLIAIPDFTNKLLVIAFYGGILSFLSTQTVRTTFNISLQISLLSIGLGLLLTLPTLLLLIM